MTDIGTKDMKPTEPVRVCEKCQEKPAQKGRAICPACRLAEWRANNPVAARWRTHIDKARRRGVPVLWGFAEFVRWAERWGFFTPSCEGMEIHRVDALAGYSFNNCRPLAPDLNRKFGATVDKFRHRQAREMKSENNGNCVDQNENPF